MNDFTGRVKREEWQPPAGLKRTLVVALDTAQYQLDMEAMQASGSEDAYSSFNLLVRRKPKACASASDVCGSDCICRTYFRDFVV